MLLDAAKLSIPIKGPLKNVLLLLLPGGITYVVVKTHSQFFQNYKLSCTYKDFLEYQKSRTATTKVLKKI